MHRIDQDGHVNNLFAEGNPELGQAATRVGADWLNAVQEEIANAIEAGGVALSKPSNDQLAGIITDLDSRLEAIEPHVDEAGEWNYSPEPKIRALIVPASAWVPGFAGQWERANAHGGYVLRSTSNGAVNVLPLNDLLPDGYRITRIDCLVKPGAARVTANRMRLSCYAQVPNFNAPAALTTGPANGVAGTPLVQDNGTTNFQLLTMMAGGTGWGAAEYIALNKAAKEVILQLESGANDSPSHVADHLLATRIYFEDRGPRSY